LEKSSKKENKKRFCAKVKHINPPKFLPSVFFSSLKKQKSLLPFKNKEKKASDASNLRKPRRVGKRRKRFNAQAKK
jgi:hypothetical protein